MENNCLILFEGTKNIFLFLPAKKSQRFVETWRRVESGRVVPCLGRGEGEEEEEEETKKWSIGILDSGNRF